MPIAVTAPFVPDATDICALTMSVSFTQAQLADLRMAVTRLTTPTVVAIPDTSANRDESAAMPTVTSDSSDLELRAEP